MFFVLLPVCVGCDRVLVVSNNFKPVLFPIHISRLSQDDESDIPSFVLSATIQCTEMSSVEKDAFVSDEISLLFQKAADSSLSVDIILCSSIYDLFPTERFDERRIICKTFLKKAIFSVQEKLFDFRNVLVEFENTGLFANLDCAQKLET
ncbi:hypothetical protein [Brazilian marseillevirus]|uniref:hypothetical protein n=1 Tax=Brazilian marseillevirus TaxID=1813599 RepID=UPI000786573A|nr:hypothetical protein A3303_gp133 [Brazilian marseillevirus]AMQ10641.1 hypothetical protein [Brazilian marseillevirus]